MMLQNGTVAVGIVTESKSVPDFYTGDKYVMNRPGIRNRWKIDWGLPVDPELSHGRSPKGRNSDCPFR